MIAYIKDTITEVTVNEFTTKNGVMLVHVTEKHTGKSFYMPAEQITLWG